jgi:hypothetical protein
MVRSDTKQEGVAAMPQGGWSTRRERRYRHVKEDLVERGRDEDKAAEIAARTVKKERARSGGATPPPSSTSNDDKATQERAVDGS